MIKPTIKLIILLLLTTLTLLQRNWLITSLLLLSASALTIMLNSFYALRQRMQPLIFIGALIIAFNLLLNPTELSLTDKLFFGLITSAKIITLSLLVFAFTSTTSVKEIVTLFSFLPDKFCLALTISLSIIPAILTEFKKVRIIQESKGFKFNYFNPIKSIAPIIVPVIHRSFQRAERIAILLEIKNY